MTAAELKRANSISVTLSAKDTLYMPANRTIEYIASGKSVARPFARLYLPHTTVTLNWRCEGVIIHITPGYEICINKIVNNFRRNSDMSWKMELARYHASTQSQSLGKSSTGQSWEMVADS